MPVALGMVQALKDLISCYGFPVNFAAMLRSSVKMDNGDIDKIPAS